MCGLHNADNVHSTRTDQVCYCPQTLRFCWRVWPRQTNLQPGVDILLKARLGHACYITKATNLPSSAIQKVLHDTCSVLVNCSDNTVIGPEIIARHLSDLMSALVQVCYAEKEESTSSDGSMKEACLALLHRLVKTNQQLVMEKLVVRLIVETKHSKGNGNAKWLHGAYKQLLAERLMSKNGVQHVINGIMHVNNGRKCSVISYFSHSYMTHKMQSPDKAFISHVRMQAQYSEICL